MKIAVLTSRFLENYIQQVLEPFQGQVDTEIFYYENTAQTEQIFASIQNRFDGFFVNGVITNAVIRRAFPDVEKPVEYFNVDMVSYCEQLIKMLLQNRGLDMERVFVDVSVFLGEEKLEQVLMEDAIEEMGSRYVRWIEALSLEKLLTVRQDLEDRLKTVWKQGKVDCVLTRFTTLVPLLEQMGIPYYFAYPSREYVRDSFRKLLSDVRVNRMKGSLPAVIQIRLKGNDKELGELEQLVLQKALMEYGRELQADFIVKSHSRFLEAVANAKSIRKLTGNGGCCRLKPYLEKELHQSLCIGYGVGEDLAAARINALNAVQEASMAADGASYLMDREEKLIGPLNGGEQLVLQAKAESWQKAAAKKAGISVLTLQKIQAAVEGVDNGQVTARLLAEKLGIGIRASSRFLVKLMQAGGAAPAGVYQGKTKGRPEQIYQVDLRKME